MNITTEDLLTSPDGFGLALATPVQRACCRARDGLPLRELASHPEVIEAFGGPEAVAALPGERGVKPTAFYNIASARTAKTTIAVCAGIVDSLTVDLSGLGHGEIPRLSIMSLKLDTADVAFMRLAETLRASRALRPLMIGEPSGSIARLRHPSGRPVEIAVVAGGAAAGGLAARWSSGLIADEAPRMFGRDERVANLDDAIAVIAERLLPGAQITAIGSPWMPAGPVYETVQQHFGKPTEHVVVMRTTGPAGNPSYWTSERLAKLKESNEVAWRINALGEFLDPETGLLSPVAIRKATREMPIELPPERDASYVAAVDPSEGGAGGNAWSLAIVRRKRVVPDSVDSDAPGREQYAVAYTAEWRGLSPDEVWLEVAKICRRYGVYHLTSDHYAASANIDLAARHGLRLSIRRTTASSKLEDFTNLATMLHTGCLELPPNRTLRNDLLSVRKRTTQSGFTIVLPRTADGRHCDLASALALALSTCIRHFDESKDARLERGRAAMRAAAARMIDRGRPPSHHSFDRPSELAEYGAREWLARALKP